MLAELEIKLGNTYDKELDINSTNAVQNKAVTEAIHNIGEVIESTTISAKSYVDNEINTLDRKKQDVIDDLNEIRNKANTALQEHQDISHLATKTSVSAELNEKVDKVSGKGLSTNDFTNNFKTKLEGLSNYDDSEVKNLITSETNRAKSVEQDLTNAITTINGTGTGSMKKTVADEIAKVIDSAPAAFDTLKEIADYINEDQEAAAVIANDLVEHSNSIEENKNEIVAISKNVTELSDEKADKNGKYADLTAGDLYGHGESVEAEFSFRASGGKSIKDGTAYVKEVHGNSVVWNQKYPDNWTYTMYGITSTSINGLISIEGTAETTITQLKPFTANELNHKYLFVLSGASSQMEGKRFQMHNRSAYSVISGGFAYIFHNNTDNSQQTYFGLSRLSAGDVISENNIRVNQYDLTKMFQAGNEPTTIEDFYRLLPTNIDINAYNEGEVIPFKADGIKSVGDNAWKEEELVVGRLANATGNPQTVSKAEMMYSPSYTKVLPNTQYFPYVGKYNGSRVAIYIYFYDAEYNYISTIQTIDNKVFTTPSNAWYIRFFVYNTGGVFSSNFNDITISLYHSGWKAEVDNTYKPYWADTLMLDARIKEAFPNGMYRAGSTYDVVRYNAETKQMEGVKRIKAVKMKDLNWSLYAASNNNTSFTASLQDIKQPSTNAERIDGALIAKYSPTTENPNTGGLVDKCWVRVTNNIYIKDDAFASAEAFANSLNDNDVLYYELADPIVTPLGEFEMDYKVADFGTEEIIGSEPSAPFNGRTIYQFNAVDQIRENYLAIEELKKNITIDSSLSTSSTNAVQNKVVTSALNGKATTTQHNQLATRVTALEKIHETLDVTVEKLVTEKVDSMDYAPNLSVGTADNLAGVDVVASDFVFRRSGGGAISDGVARVESIKGNSVVWNQKINNVYNINGVGGWFIRQGEGNANFDNNIVTINLVSGVSTIPQLVQNVGFISNHKYLITFEYNIVLTESSKNMYLILRQSNDKYGNSESPITDRAIGINEKSGHKDIFFTAVADKPMFLIKTYEYTNDIGESVSIIKPKVIDLTKMFGAGYEPTTIEDFYRLLPSNIDFNAYNEGEIIDMRAEGIKSVGRNAWDEEWENGSFLVIDGTNQQTKEAIRNKNYIKVLPNQGYYFKMPTNYRFVFYDEQQNYISGDSKSTNQVITTPSNCHYLRFSVGTSNNKITTYNNDICINISDTDFNGTYFPYTENAEDLSFIKDIFPNGMRSAGTAHDEIRYNKTTNKWEAVKRIAEVDLGDLSFAISTAYDNTSYNAPLTDAKVNSSWSVIPNLCCARYSAGTPNSASGIGTEKDVISLTPQNKIAITPSKVYNSIAELKADLKGVMLYYELAEPIVTEITADIVDNPDFNLDYNVWNCGTEQMIATEPSSAIKADITYGFNAVGLIKQLRTMIEAMQTQLNNLGGIVN